MSTGNVIPKLGQRKHCVKSVRIFLVCTSRIRTDQKYPQYGNFSRRLRGTNSVMTNLKAADDGIILMSCNFAKRAMLTKFE